MTFDDLLLLILALFVFVLVLCAPRQCHATNRYDGLIKKYASRFFGQEWAQENWQVIKAQIHQESSFRPTARSRHGATGLMQTMPATGRRIAKELGIKHVPTDPESSIAMGCCYDAKMSRMFDEERGWENIRFMLSAYNAGPGRIIHAQNQAEQCDRCTNKWECIKRFVPRETMFYVERIHEYYLEYVAYGMVLEIRQ